jgi:hypothetical protein
MMAAAEESVMAKLKADAVTKADLIEFLNDESDFAFEIETLHTLIGHGFSCEHSGTYDDPVTQKPREFDIRATKRYTRCFLRLAVECKNLRENYPVLISCMPRRHEEAFHEIVCSVNLETHELQPPHVPRIPAMEPKSQAIRLQDEWTIYRAGDPVGKSCDQVGRTLNGEITSGDSGVYDKWAQALSSASDLIADACSDGEERTKDVALSFVLPVVVVPNGRLWQTQYDAVGKRTVGPERTERCSYYLGRRYSCQSPLGGHDVIVSHLEFVTSDGLLELVDTLCGNEAKQRMTFHTPYGRELLDRGRAS